MGAIRLLLLLTAPPQSSIAQTDSLSVSHRFEAQVQILAADKLKHVYYVTPQQVLYKCNLQGQVLFEFSNRYLGTLSKVDASDPFDVLLYYADFQTILFLDRTLNVTADIRLPADRFPLPALVTLGPDRGVWIYDAALNTLVQINRQGEPLRQSQDLSLLLGRTINPTQLVSTAQAIYLVDPIEGVFQFDLFAQFQQFYPLPKVEQLQSFDQYLLFRRQGLYFLGTQLSTAQAIPLIPASVTYFCGIPSCLLAWDGQQVLVFER